MNAKKIQVRRQSMFDAMEQEILAAVKPSSNCPKCGSPAVWVDEKHDRVYCPKCERCYDC